MKKLQKSPIVNDDTSLGRQAPDAPMAERYRSKSFTMPIGDKFYHHVHSNTNEESMHLLSDSPDPFDQKATIFAQMVGDTKRHMDPLTVQLSSVNPAHKGKGYGKLLYKLALNRHGTLHSDELVSPKANKVWEHLESQGADVQFGKPDTRERHTASGSVPIPKKLAASEKLTKAPVRSPRKGHTIKQLESLKQDNWHNPDTGTEISAEEGQEHLNRMHQNRADKKVKQWISQTKKPKSQAPVDNPADWLGEPTKKGNLKLEHFSPSAGLKEINPSFKGKGVDARTKGRDSEHPHSFYYIAGTEPEHVVTQGAKSKYTIEIPDEAKIYDLHKDPEGIISGLHKLAQNRQVNAGIVQMDDVHHVLKQKGYHGFMNSGHPTLPNVVALYHSAPVAHEQSLTRSEAMDFFCKSEKTLAATGLALLYPVSIGGKSHRENGTPYHATVKFFDKDGISPEHAHAFASKENLSIPDPKNTHVTPKVFKNRFGEDVYVLSLHGEGVEHIKGINGRAKDMGLPTAYVFQPHISVDKEIFDHVSKNPNMKASDLGLSFGNAELRHGPKTLATYPDKKDHGSSAIYRKYKM